jgi:hypothetical protein
MKPDRCLPDTFDQIEHISAFLVAHGIAKDTPEQPDILSQPRVRFEGGDILSAVNAGFRIGRQHLGRHRLLQKLPGGP